ncbi:MAG: TonB-dependent receptor [Gemmatimonadaceae bacterium]
MSAPGVARLTRSFRSAGLAGALIFGPILAAQAHAQESRSARGIPITGVVRDASSGAPLVGAIVRLEEGDHTAVTDSTGSYRLTGALPGPQILLVRRIAYAPHRLPITVPAAGTLTVDVRMPRVALTLEKVVVTADATARAHGELGTASVIGQDAIANQTAASLAQILELVPGVPLSAPGLDGTQQISLRAAPAVFPSGQGTSSLGSFGTLIILDGVPLSNNANLQSAGARSEIGVPTSAGGGIDLRRIPASTIERVEVIRGIPSARYGDLTQGAIVVDTRAGAVRPELLARYDPRTLEVSAVGGRAVGDAQTATLTADVAQTKLAPGVRDDEVTRFDLTLAHRATLRRAPGAADEQAGLVLDSRLEVFRLEQNSPEQPTVRPGATSFNRDHGLRLIERLRLGAADERHLQLSLALDHTTQNSGASQLKSRGALPFTDRLVEGRAIGHYLGGQYRATETLDGVPWLLYGRAESEFRSRRLDFDHRARLGAELRREWNSGPGYQFNIEFPPQTNFNGVNGFDRPRRYDAVPPMATSALYVDDRAVRELGAGVWLEAQAGLRLETLHSGSTWLSGARNAVLQPRLNVQLSPTPWLRLRGGAGRTAKSPSLDQLDPARQYYDVVNVNWYTNDPAGRLAVLTTSIRDPRNRNLGFAISDKRELGVEADLGQTGAALSLVGFSDKLSRGFGVRSLPGFLLREHFQLSDSSTTSGRPPQIIEPASSVDTVPILIDQPANNIALASRGLELTLSTPVLPLVRTKVELQGAYISSEFTFHGLDVGVGTDFGSFQQGITRRLAYWDGFSRVGERALLTTRLVHHEPELGLIVTGTFQHTFHERMHDITTGDTLSFAGYLTRSGELVAVPAASRGDPQYADIRRARVGVLTNPDVRAPDWVFSLQVSKTLPLEGKLSFYAWNAFDRLGTFAGATLAGRLYAPVRFGADVTIPFAALTAWR